MSQRWHLHNSFQLRQFNEFIQHQWLQGKKPTVEFTASRRSTEQNAMLHDLIREICSQKGDETEDELKRYIKLHIGVPILRGTDEEFGEKYDSLIKDNLTYEQKLQAMDLLPVTSRMNKDQFARLIDATILHFTQQGIELTPHGP